jgi:murein DD-endopeptidase MepM/ murein hydrolase activator NlpD
LEWALILGTLLLATACTTYRPVDQGARVPWAAALAQNRGDAVEKGQHRVGQGEALGHIAKRYGIGMDLLAEANNIPPPYVIYPGEVLRIPTADALPAAKPLPIPVPEARAPTEIVQAERQQAPSVRPSPPRRSQETAALAPTVETLPAADIDGVRHVVRQGESLAVIAARYRVSLADLIAANGVRSPSQVTPGRSLIIPGSEAERRGRALADQALARQEIELGSGAILPPPPLSHQGFIWPVRGPVIKEFGSTQRGGRNDGISIAARPGTPVLAADNGIVAYAGEALKGYGRMLLVRHAEGYVTAYAHNATLLVREGESVRRGQVIARVGDSGDVKEAQLHFELRKGTEPIDPTSLLVADGGTVVSQR